MINTEYSLSSLHLTATAQTSTRLLGFLGILLAFLYTSTNTYQQASYSHTQFCTSIFSLNVYRHVDFPLPARSLLVAVNSCVLFPRGRPRQSFHMAPGWVVISPSQTQQQWPS